MKKNEISTKYALITSITLRDYLEGSLVVNKRLRALLRFEEM